MKLKPNLLIVHNPETWRDGGDVRLVRLEEGGNYSSLFIHAYRGQADYLRATAEVSRIYNLMV